MERYAEAIPYFKEGATLDPADTHLLLALAWCYKRNRRLDLAIEALEAALDADPTLAILHYNLACYWSLAGNVKFAVSFLAQAFDLQPNYRELVDSERDFDPIRKLPLFLSLTAAAV